MVVVRKAVASGLSPQALEDALGFFARGEDLPTPQVVRVVCSRKWHFASRNGKEGHQPTPEIRNALTKPIVAIYNLDTECCTRKWTFERQIIPQEGFH